MTMTCGLVDALYMVKTSKLILLGELGDDVHLLDVRVDFNRHVTYVAQKKNKQIVKYQTTDTIKASVVHSVNFTCCCIFGVTVTCKQSTNIAAGFGRIVLFCKASAKIIDYSRILTIRYGRRKGFLANIYSRALLSCPCLPYSMMR